MAPGQRPDSERGSGQPPQTPEDRARKLLLGIGEHLRKDTRIADERAEEIRAIGDAMNDRDYDRAATLAETFLDSLRPAQDSPEQAAKQKEAALREKELGIQAKLDVVTRALETIGNRLQPTYQGQIDTFLAQIHDAFASRQLDNAETHLDAFDVFLNKIGPPLVQHIAQRIDPLMEQLKAAGHLREGKDSSTQHVASARATVDAYLKRREWRDALTTATYLYRDLQGLAELHRVAPLRTEENTVPPDAAPAPRIIPPERLNAFKREREALEARIKRMYDLYKSTGSRITGPTRSDVTREFLAFESAVSRQDQDTADASKERLEAALLPLEQDLVRARFEYANTLATQFQQDHRPLTRPERRHIQELVRHRDAAIAEHNFGEAVLRTEAILAYITELADAEASLVSHAGTPDSPPDQTPEPDPQPDKRHHLRLLAKRLERELEARKRIADPTAMWIEEWLEFAAKAHDTQLGDAISGIKEVIDATIHEQPQQKAQRLYELSREMFPSPPESTPLFLSLAETRIARGEYAEAIRFLEDGLAKRAARKDESTLLEEQYREPLVVVDNEQLYANELRDTMTRAGWQDVSDAFRLGEDARLTDTLRARVQTNYVTVARIRIATNSGAVQAEHKELTFILPAHTPEDTPQLPPLPAEGVAQTTTQQFLIERHLTLRPGDGLVGSRPYADLIREMRGEKTPLAKQSSLLERNFVPLHEAGWALTDAGSVRAIRSGNPTPDHLTDRFVTIVMIPATEQGTKGPGVLAMKTSDTVPPSLPQDQASLPHEYFECYPYTVLRDGREVRETAFLPIIVARDGRVLQKQESRDSAHHDLLRQFFALRWSVLSEDVAELWENRRMSHHGSPFLTVATVYFPDGSTERLYRYTSDEALPNLFPEDIPQDLPDGVRVEQNAYMAIWQLDEAGHNAAYLDQVRVDTRHNELVAVNRDARDVLVRHMAERSWIPMDPHLVERLQRGEHFPHLAQSGIYSAQSVIIEVPAPEPDPIGTPLFFFSNTEEIPLQELWEVTGGEHIRVYQVDHAEGSAPHFVLFHELTPPAGTSREPEFNTSEPLPGPLAMPHVLEAEPTPEPTAGTFTEEEPTHPAQLDAPRDQEAHQDNRDKKKKGVPFLQRAALGVGKFLGKWAPSALASFALTGDSEPPRYELPPQKEIHERAPQEILDRIATAEQRDTPAPPVAPEQQDMPKEIESEPQPEQPRLAETPRPVERPEAESTQQHLNVPITGKGIRLSVRNTLENFLLQHMASQKRGILSRDEMARAHEQAVQAVLDGVLERREAGQPELDDIAWGHIPVTFTWDEATNTIEHLTFGDVQKRVLEQPEPPAPEADASAVPEKPQNTVVEVPAGESFSVAGQSFTGGETRAYTTKGNKTGPVHVVGVSTVYTERSMQDPQTGATTVVYEKQENLLLKPEKGPQFALPATEENLARVASAETTLHKHDNIMEEPRADGTHVLTLVKSSGSGDTTGMGVFRALEAYFAHHLDPNVSDTERKTLAKTERIATVLASGEVDVYDRGKFVGRKLLKDVHTFIGTKMTLDAQKLVTRVDLRP